MDHTVSGKNDSGFFLLLVYPRAPPKNKEESKTEVYGVREGVRTHLSE